MLLKTMFPKAKFSAPATPTQISHVEQNLGVTFPDQLRDLYLQCDGFREPLGNAKYLLSLEDDDFVGSLKSTTRFWWNEWPEIAANWPDFTGFLFFGMSSADEVWGIRLIAPFEVIAYHHSMEAAFETVGTNILEVFKADFVEYPD